MSASSRWTLVSPRSTSALSRWIARFAQVDSRFAQVDRRFDEMRRIMDTRFYWTIGIMVTLFGAQTALIAALTQL